MEIAGTIWVSTRRIWSQSSRSKFREVHVQKTRVRILADKNITKFINRNRKHYGFISEKIKGNSVEMTFMTSDLEHGFPRGYLMFGDYSKIVEPEILKHRVKAILEKTASNL